MNRIGLKSASKQSLNDTTTSPVVTTLVYLLILYVISGITTVASRAMLPDTLVNSSSYSYDAYAQALIGFYSSVKGLGLYIFAIAVSLLRSVFNVGYNNYCFKLSRRTAKGLEDIFSSVNMAGKILWLTFLIEFFTTLWTMLFIIPGIIAQYRYKMAYYALLDNPNLTARQALNVSKSITKGYKLDLFVLDLSFIGWNILAALTFGIVYIWKLPYIETTYAHAYNRLNQLRPQPSSPEGYIGPEIL